MQRTSTIVFGVVLLCACRAKRAAPIATADPADAAKAAPSASALPTSPRALAGYPSPIDPTGPGCELAGPWDRDAPRALRFRPSAPPFATFPSTKNAKLTLLEGENAFGFVELASKEIRAYGFVTEKLVLHASKPLLLAGYVVPAVAAPLAWHQSHAGKVTIDFDTGTFLRPLPTGGPLREERACSDVRLGDASFAASDDPIPEPTLQHGDLPVHKLIPLRRERTGKPVAEIDPKGCSSLSARLVELAGDPPNVDARVVVAPCSGADPSRGYTVVGWIPAALFKENKYGSGTGGSWGYGGGVGASGRRRKGAKRVICETEVPFTAEQAGEIHLVGVIAPRVAFDVIEPGSGGFVEIDSGRAGIVAAEGVTLRAKESVMAKCKPE